MRLVLVHGRAQQGKDPRRLEDEWLTGLKAGLGGVELPPEVEVRFPFYGDLLDELIMNLDAGLVSRGDDTRLPDDDVSVLFAEALAERAGVAVEDAVAARGPGTRLIHEILERVESALPWVAHLAMRKFTDDVKIYLENAHIRREINSCVGADLSGDDCVVIAHSLGSVVAYDVLSNGTDTSVKLLVTAGSPLGLPAIRRSLKHPLTIPSDEWLNATDPDDIVALKEELTATTFRDGIDNLSDVDNGDSPHSIAGYLSDERVAQRIAYALKSQ